MDSDYLPELLARVVDGFTYTLQLLGWSALICTVVGTLLGGMRVAPVAPLRFVGTAYVNVFRNTPLLVLFILSTVGLPPVGIRVDFFWDAVIALSLYTSAFVCEAVRSGINTVDPGQAEAARSIGMGFGRSLRLVILPQAFRNVIPPLASIYIALTKNTAIAAAFGVTEATYQLSNLIEDLPGSLYFNFFGISAGYILIVAVISAIASLLERRVAVSR